MIKFFIHLLNDWLRHLIQMLVIIGTIVFTFLVVGLGALLSLREVGATWALLAAHQYEIMMLGVFLSVPTYLVVYFRWFYESDVPKKRQR
ncbi:MAG: hypothetical protein OZSIB_2265 [Candidatus Ozemobacter sibiricus]|uniref:Uncharacterized protein n=1 Tax=Candidatus Ozemobacter sibiricus TaxID=2268124 RepID=A0A367ZTM0_9BACT|nr:MAG: hypothetical protein OZSIB_2265 [Candidatus Ozemobacter sibiricus]